MNFFKKNRARAAVLAVIIIAASLVGGTFRSLKALESKVEREYTAADKFGESVRQTTEALSLHLSGFAAQYLTAMGRDSRLDELEKIAAALESRDGAICREDAEIARLRTLAADMKEHLDLSNKYDGAVRTAYAGLDNDLSILKKYDAYNKAAARYNEASEGFTGRIFGMQSAADFS